MAQVIVRKLEDSVKKKLQRRAARHKHSMEEEIRDILRNAVRLLSLSSVVSIRWGCGKSTST
jgi:plasmid stability protein